jgi:hypothetical protein
MSDIANKLAVCDSKGEGEGEGEEGDFDGDFAEYFEELDESVKKKLTNAEGAFVRGNYAAALDLYGAIIQQEAAGGGVAGGTLTSFPLLARCHLNVAALLIATDRFSHCLQRCQLITAQYTSYLTEHQYTRILYFTTISSLKTYPYQPRLARIALDSLFRHVRQSKARLPEDEMHVYRDLEREVARMVGYCYYTTTTIIIINTTTITTITITTSTTTTTIIVTITITLHYYAMLQLLCYTILYYTILYYTKLYTIYYTIYTYTIYIYTIYILYLYLSIYLSIYILTP